MNKIKKSRLHKIHLMEDEISREPQLYASPATPQLFAARIDAETGKWSKVIKERGFCPDVAVKGRDIIPSLVSIRIPLFDLS